MDKDMIDIIVKLICLVMLIGCIRFIFLKGKESEDRLYPFFIICVVKIFFLFWWVLLSR